MNPSKLATLTGTGERSRAAEKQTVRALGSFRDYYVRTFFRPRQTFDALMLDHRRLAFGLLAVSISAALYTLVYVGLAAGGGAPSSFAPWLAIPADVYYFYDIFFAAPSMFMCWILAAGVVQLLSRLAGGQGSFEDNLSVLGFGLSAATWSLGVHDLADSLLGAVHIISTRAYEAAMNAPGFWHNLLWTLMTLYLIAFIFYFSKGIGAAQRIRPVPAFVLGVVAFVVYQGVFFIFNR